MGQRQEGHQLMGQMQAKGGERWSDTGEEEEFWSVRESVLLQDGDCNCVSGLCSCFGPKGSGGAWRSDGAACSPTESYESSGSFC